MVWEDASQKRNIIYVQDCIYALLKMEEAFFPSLILNVENEKRIVIRKLAKTIVKVSGKKIEIKYDRSKHVGPLRRIPSTSKAWQIHGWSSTSSLEIGIRRTFDWMKQQDAPTLTRGYGLRLNT